MCVNGKRFLNPDQSAECRVHSAWHGDDLIPWQQSLRTYDALMKREMEGHLVLAPQFLRGAMILRFRMSITVILNLSKYSRSG